MPPPHRVEHPLNERLVRVLERALGSPATVDTYGRPVAATGAAEAVGANAYLWVTPDRPQIEFTVYPADTLTQARAFYRHHHALAGVRELVSNGWEVVPNFHFGSFQRGYCWTCNQRELEDYVTLWVARVERTGAVAREHWDRYWSWLERERIACPADRAEFERHFVQNNRNAATPRPGLKLSRQWPLEIAHRPTVVDELGRAVREQLDAALAAFGARRISR